METQNSTTENNSTEAQVLKECSNCMEGSSTLNENEQKELNNVTEKKNSNTTEKTQTKATKPEKNGENLDEELISQPKGSLQEAFEKFRKKRLENFKHKKYLQEIKQKDHKSNEFKDALRQKFIETAKKYYGVPYAKRFYQPGDAHYNAPIFLDCCGLIRQIVFDLREDFGFTLQRWNQCYQFDTLPIALKFEELKPGDLIFYSATYYDPKCKKQRHDMVHVEIFIGGPTGEQSIGARFFKSVVKLWDSYKFESTSYYDIKFHFRSLDTWLEGTCKSFCPQHPWRDDRDLWASDKYSIFANGEEDNDACYENADGEPYEGPIEEIKSNSVEKGEISQQPKQAYIGRGNNEKLVKDFFASCDDWKILEQKLGFSKKFDFKWVQSTTEIDYLNLKEGQIVNHISNISTIANKKNLLQMLRDFEEVGDGSKDADLKLADIMPPTFRLDLLSDELLFINHPNKGLWITKSQNPHQSGCLKLIRNVELFKKEFMESKTFYLGEFSTHEVPERLAEAKEKMETRESREFKNIGPNTLIQKYIENPLLVDKRKFDIRCFVLVASTSPFLVFYADGYARLSLKEYNPEIEDFDQIMHLTNNYVQKRHTEYKNRKEDSIWSMERLKNCLSKELNISNEKQEAMFLRMKRILQHVFKVAEKKLDKRPGIIELLNCDFIIDADLNPFLIEINTNPSLLLDTKTQEEVLPNLINSTISLVLELQKDPKAIAEAAKSILKQKNFGPFEVLYNPTEL